MYSLLATPIVTGLVGYCTNWLAIKMLFRPHRKSLWSLGWQGVIPKNRSKLAAEIGVLVGDKLLRQEELKSAFTSESVQEKLERAIENELRNFLEKDFGTLREILEKTGLSSKAAIAAILETANSGGLIDSLLTEAGAKISKNIFETKIGVLDEHTESIKNAVNGILAGGQLQNEAVNSISASINNFVMSGKSLADVMPESLMAKTDKFCGFLTEKILSSLDTAMDDPATRKKLSRKLIDLKNGHFSEGAMSQMKLGVLNMFMTEETIEELVDEYLPKLITSVKESEEVKRKIAASLDGYIQGLMKKPLFMHADAIGLESLFQLRSSVVTAAQKTLGSEQFSEKISSWIGGLIKNNADKTLGEVLESAGLKEAVSAQAQKGIRINLHDIAEYLDGFAGKIHVRNVYAVIPKKVFYTIKMAMLSEINTIVDKNTPKMLEVINFPKITEDRINSLDLYEVENLLFSFMKDSFRWINILGFVLGFMFGLAQSAVFYFIG